MPLRSWRTRAVHASGGTTWPRSCQSLQAQGPPALLPPCTHVRAPSQQRCRPRCCCGWWRAAPAGSKKRGQSRVLHSTTGWPLCWRLTTYPPTLHTTPTRSRTHFRTDIATTCHSTAGTRQTNEPTGPGLGPAVPAPAPVSAWCRLARGANASIGEERVNRSYYNHTAQDALNCPHSPSPPGSRHKPQERHASKLILPHHLMVPGQPRPTSPNYRASAAIWCTWWTGATSASATSGTAPPVAALPSTWPCHGGTGPPRCRPPVLVGLGAHTAPARWTPSSSSPCLITIIIISSSCTRFWQGTALGMLGRATTSNGKGPCLHGRREERECAA